MCLACLSTTKGECWSGHIQAYRCEHVCVSALVKCVLRVGSCLHFMWSISCCGTKGQPGCDFKQEIGIHSKQTNRLCVLPITCHTVVTWSAAVLGDTGAECDAWQPSYTINWAVNQTHLIFLLKFHYGWRWALILRGHSHIRTLLA